MTHNIRHRIIRKFLLEFVDSLGDLKRASIQMKIDDLLDLEIHLSPKAKEFLEKIRNRRELIGIVEAKPKIIDLLKKEGAKFVVNSSQKISYIDGEYFGNQQIIFIQ